ncbi:MAG: hypothetical protein QJR13_08115, partial [Bacillota bacterium]|nr:hypothetical protein [Bacillota bacterium]
ARAPGGSSDGFPGGLPGKERDVLREVLAVVVPLSLLAPWQEALAAAGLELAGIVPSGLAMAAAYRELEETAPAGGREGGKGGERGRGEGAPGRPLALASRWDGLWDVAWLSGGRVQATRGWLEDGRLTPTWEELRATCTYFARRGGVQGPVEVYLVGGEEPVGAGPDGIAQGEVGKERGGEASPGLPPEVELRWRPWPAPPASLQGRFLPGHLAAYGAAAAALRPASDTLVLVPPPRPWPVTRWPWPVQAGVLAALAVLLAGAGLELRLGHARGQLALLRQRAAAVQATAEVAGERAGEAERLRAELEALRRLQGETHNPLDLLAELAERLPQGSRIQYLALEGERVLELRGRGPSATAVLQALQESRLFPEVQLAAPIVAIADEEAEGQGGGAGAEGTAGARPREEEFRLAGRAITTPAEGKRGGGAP